jgi:GH25 family lysozyme M1 (1,4-beta-N-acetylmuramidase)
VARGAVLAQLVSTMKRLFLLPFVFALSHCSSPAPSGGGGAAAQAVSRGMPQIINVSAYDPKERQREGRGYSENDVSALRANGASGLIARAGKGGVLDTKCASFLAAADRAGMLPGVYYRLQNHVDAVSQADQFVSRAQSLARGRGWNAPALLLCGDFDANSRLSDILRFMDRVEARTGVVPVAYLENSTHLKQLLSGADSATKAKLRRMPYWLALYAHDSGAGPVYPAPGNPRGLLNQYRVWGDWTLWQYGGVDWEGGRSRPKVYNHGAYRFSSYFGNLDRPLERNVFNGSHGALQSFWQQHGLRLR